MRIQPSILSADFANLEAEFASISSADGIHVDVMDGHFVPNMTFGLPVVKRMQEITTLPLDVHLMIENPDLWAPKYAALGVFSVTVHFEACKDLASLIPKIKDEGSRIGVAIKPGTPVTAILPLLEQLDQVLVMSVEPGFGGQSFIPSSLDKIVELRRLLGERGLATWVQVDGGITAENIAQVAAAGADTFVAGSSVFGALDRNEMISRLRTLAVESAH
ncbi:MAG: ribulose-phosphate 3-epimerase [Actinomycetota bacterium]|jgi:ribulose-phosphate 3-epimerase